MKRFQSNPTQQTNLSRIDEENQILYGVTAMNEGEALGHGMWADGVTLSMMVDLANEKPGGIRGRLGHEGMSENSVAKRIGTSKNFRVEGKSLRHDWFAWQPASESPSFTQDPIRFIFNVARNCPQDMGESVVVKTDLAWVHADGSESPYYDVDEDGWEYATDMPEDSAYPYPAMRPTDFYFVDIVDEGALTSDTGLFTSLYSGNSSSLSASLFKLADDWVKKYDIPADQIPTKVNQVLSKYMASRFSMYQTGGNMQQNYQAVEEVEPVPIPAQNHPVAEPQFVDPLLDEEELDDEEVVEEVHPVAEPIPTAQPHHVQPVAQPIENPELDLSELTALSQEVLETSYPAEAEPATLGHVADIVQQLEGLRIENQMLRSAVDKANSERQQMFTSLKNALQTQRQLNSKVNRIVEGRQAAKKISSPAAPAAPVAAGTQPYVQPQPPVAMSSTPSHFSERVGQYRSSVGENPNDAARQRLARRAASIKNLQSGAA